MKYPIPGQEFEHAVGVKTHPPILIAIYQPEGERWQNIADGYDDWGAKSAQITIRQVTGKVSKGMLCRKHARTLYYSALEQQPQDNFKLEIVPEIADSGCDVCIENERRRFVKSLKKQAAKELAERLRQPKKRANR